MWINVQIMCKNMQDIDTISEKYDKNIWNMQNCIWTPDLSLWVNGCPYMHEMWRTSVSLRIV